MIVTLYLISANVYNAVEAPKGRGFSYTEVWILGTQFPILLALCEYGYVLYLLKIEEKNEKKRQHSKPNHHFCTARLRQRISLI